MLQVSSGMQDFVASTLSASNRVLLQCCLPQNWTASVISWTFEWDMTTDTMLQIMGLGHETVSRLNVWSHNVLI